MIIKLIGFENNYARSFQTPGSWSAELPVFEFHIHASARRKYEIDESLFTLSGNIIFPNFRAVRILANRMNENRQQPREKIRPGDLNAMGLIDEIYHYVMRLYEEKSNPAVFHRALSYINKELPQNSTYNCLHTFGELFPPLTVYRKDLTLEDYINKATASKPNQEVMLEELMMLYFANFNPAFLPFRELFEDTILAEKTIYKKTINALESFFRNEKPFGPENQYIFDLLREPILASPKSLQGQLAFIRSHWGLLLSDKYLKKILSADDLMKEDLRLIFPGPAQSPPVPHYTTDLMKGISDLEFERFTSDLDWMPNVVLIAKNIYVWTHQLSKMYQRQITRLHEIPDEELDRLSRWNITALWLIGIWERSPSSQKIKQWTGNPEAAPSAYSLFDYVISNELGGEESFKNLQYRAWQRGIRLASDMVPNHTGIFSKWIIDHPEYFIQSKYPPFPNYRYTGGNLSQRPELEIRIEDGYWNRNDAAVTFQRIDTQTGEHRYIYHGNDGTHMPWNDTAQLNFLRADVREAVIQTIMHVARMFPIIRFDAAMTLTKRHYQRLWFPTPGSGGDIPSRADYALSTEEFNTLFPTEFWREVVDRINHELPNTLLIAEAFWLLEGYFVRTLGMHRVYNSAFMHMLMREENSKYRELIKNTLHYNPEILKRYVNFMSNPDEETAVSQFGKEDKYFGVALLMVTLPGLPMFAHGQIEGYHEKYGMEYKRSYYDEAADTDLIRRHEEEIFPLLRQRYMFSQVEHFELYDMVDSHGNVDEDVIAYSNIHGNQRALICFNNKYKETSGWIKQSAGHNVGSTDNPQIIYKNLGQGLEISDAEDVFYTFRDHTTHLEYIRSGSEFHERGLFVELKAFHYHIFLDFREIRDTGGDYEKLRRHLHGKGTHNLHEEMQKVRLFPIFLKLSDAVSQKPISVFSSFLLSTDQTTEDIAGTVQPLINRYKPLISSMAAFLNLQCDIESATGALMKKIDQIRDTYSELKTDTDEKINLTDIAAGENLLILYIYTIITSAEEALQQRIFSLLHLDIAFQDITVNAGIKGLNPGFTNNLLRFILSEKFISDPKFFRPEKINELLDDPDIRSVIQCNLHNGIIYYNKERMENLLRWIYTLTLLNYRSVTKEEIKLNEVFLRGLIESSTRSRYRLEEFRSGISKLEGKHHA